MFLCIFVSFSLTESSFQFSKETDHYIEENKLRVVIVSITQPQVEQPIDGLPHAKETTGVHVAEEKLDNVNEAPNVVNEVCNPLKATFISLRGTPTFNENSSPVNECPTILQDFIVPPKQASFTLSKSASNLQETSAVSIETQFSSTEASVDLKESPPLDCIPAPSEVPSLSDIESTNADNAHIPHVSFFSSIVHVLLHCLAYSQSINILCQFILVMNIKYRHLITNQQFLTSDVCNSICYPFSR